MIIREQLEKLAKEKNMPCVTISLNTHRTHPDSDKDAIVLKKLLKEAEIRVIDEYKEYPIDCLLERIRKIRDEIDIRCNLDSLHIFLSNDTQEVVRLAWPAAKDGVYIDETFEIRTLIKAYNRTEEHLILLMSLKEVHLYHARNEEILEEIVNEDLPITDNPWYLKNGAERSNARLVDDIHREFFNRMDKAIVKVAQERQLKCVVICVEENYSYLQEVADQPEIYLGHIAVDYNNTKEHQLADQAWCFIQELQYKQRTEAIEEMKEAVSRHHVLTDLQEIYQASLDGRGDMLIVHDDFSQSVIMTDERTFERIDDPDDPAVIDDITSTIAWEVFSKKGKVFFTCQDEIKELGDIVLKVRY